MDMPVVGDQSLARKTEIELCLDSFGQGFGRDRIAAGLLSMWRWGVISVQHFAAAAGVSYRQANDIIKPDLLRFKLVKSPKIIQQEKKDGRPPVMLALAQAGYDRLCEAIHDSWHVENPEKILGPFHAPCSSLDWKGKRAHRLGLIDMLIAIERNARSHGGAGLRDVIPEFQSWQGLKKPTLITLSTNSSFQADAALIMTKDENSWLQMIEYDLGTETIVSEDATRLQDTLEGKAKLHWRYMSSERFIDRFSVTSDQLYVLFITTTRARRDSIINKLASKLDCGGVLPIRGIAPHEVFFFTTIDDAKDDFFGRHWRDLHGNPSSILGQ